jgi:exonuclease SbcC
MIETVEIKNFQGHECTILEFDKGLNVIKGTSHSGKSSIWRALRWALQNRPLGEDFKSYFATKEDEVSVALEFDNGVLIRSKSNKENLYDITNIDSGHIELKAIKSDVPTEVTDLSQLSEVNLQGQDDPYFLILDSPGGVARKLNEAVGLDIIDLSMSKANSIISKENIALKVIDEELSKAEDDLESLLWLDEVGPKVVKVDEDIKKAELIDNRIYHLYKAIERIRDTEDIIKEYNHYLKVEDSYIDLMIKFEKREELNKRIGRLKYLIIQTINYGKDVEKHKKWLSIEEKYIQLSQKVTQREQLLGKFRQLKVLCKRISDTEIVVNSANKDVRNLQSKYDTLLKSTNACPLCGRAW